MWDLAWSSARFHLRLSAREFMNLTPRQLHILMARHREKVRHDELLFGILASTVANYTANFSMGRPERPLKSKPKDFMPSEWGKPSGHRPRTKIDRRKVADDIRTLFNARIAQQA